MPAAETAIDIDAPIDTIWSVMLDFPSYPEWNPFIIGYEGPKTLAIGTRFRLTVEWANKKRASSVEQVTGLEPYALVYRYADLPSVFGLVLAERQQILTAKDGRVHYWTRDAFRGPLTPFLPLAAVQDGFERQARALKARAEAIAFSALKAT
jgi:hypothetical protein